MFYPLFAQLVGIIFWILLTYGAVDLVSIYFPNINLWFLWGVFLLANLPGMYLFFNGFWRYLIWVSALNLVVRELVEQDSCKDVLAYALRITSRPVDYSVILTFLFGIVFVPFGFAVLPIGLGASNPDWFWACAIASVVILFVGSLLVCTGLIFFSLVFQVFAFTPGSAGSTIFRSMDLVAQDVVKTIAIIAASVGMTQFILPMLIMWVFDILHLTAFLADGFQMILQYALSRGYMDVRGIEDEYPYLSMVLTQLEDYIVPVSRELARTVVLTFSSAFLLPLGTV